MEGDILPAGSITGRNYLPWSFRFCACRPRRHKLRIACFRLTAKIRSLHCAISALSAAALRRLRSETPACGRVSFPHRTRCAGLRRGPRAAGQESSCFSFPLAVYGLAKTCGKGLVLPPAAEVAPSETEGAGPGAGSRLVSAKAAGNLVERSSPSLFARSALFFWTVHGPFSFRHDEKKMGGGSRPPMAMGAEPVPRARGDEIPPADAIEKRKDFLQNPGRVSLTPA